MNAQPKTPGAIANRSMPPGVIIPEFVYGDLEAAVAWLCKAFGFIERLRIGNHRAQLVFGGARRKRARRKRWRAAAGPFGDGAG